MEPKHSNLIWVLAASAVLLAVMVVCHDTAYAEYKNENPDMPLPALFISAAQNDIYPWTADYTKANDYIKGDGGADNVDGDDTAAGENPENEDDSSAGISSMSGSEGSDSTVSGKNAGNKDTPESIEADKANDTTGSGLIASGSEAAIAALSTASEAAFKEQQVSDSVLSASASESVQEADTGISTGPQYVEQDVTYFEDACIIGDSFTEGISMFAQIPQTDYLGHKGLSTHNVLKHKFKLPDGGSGTLEDAMSKKEYGKVYIMLGINEIGGVDPEAFSQRYKDVITKVREYNPEAVVYIQSILHTTQNKSSNSQFKNKYVDEYNAALKELADNDHVFYIDLNPLFDDETGALTSEYSSDGVHLKAPKYIEWRDYLLQHTVEPGKSK